MRILPALLLIATFAACAAGCSKKEPDGTGAENFRPPTNQARVDYLDMLDRRFAKLDESGDGALQPGEIVGTRVAEIKALDSDRDGEVSREEFVNGGLAHFDRIDTNHDGVLSSAERRADRAEGGDAADTPPK
jgi:hypothetical protein